MIRVRNVLSFMLVVFVMSVSLLPVGDFALKTVNAAPVGATGTKILAAGANHTLVLKEDGTLWAYGDNKYGSLGTETSSSGKAVKVMDKVKFVEAAKYLSAAVKTDNTLWIWGNSNFMGSGSSSTITKPFKFMSDVKSVAFGDSFMLIVKTDGDLLTMGLNSDGQLGNGSSLPSIFPAQIMTGVRSVSAGAGHALVVKTDGTLWVFGRNSEGQLGDNSTTKRNQPYKIMDKVAMAEAGGIHSLAIKTDGTLWSFGMSNDGQTGVYSSSPILKPQQITTNVANASAGRLFSAIVKTDGTLWVFGNNEKKQLGSDNLADQTTPLKIMGDVKDVACGFYSTHVIKENGTLWDIGEVVQDDGTIQTVSKPEQVASDSDGFNYYNEVVSATGITLNKPTTTINVDGTEKLVATVLPDSATNKEVAWFTTDATVVSIDSIGNVTGLKPGTVIVTAKTTDGSNLSASCTVTVLAKAVPITSITLNKTTTRLKVTDGETLVATVMPYGATNKVFTWESSNTTVASVDNVGRITALSVGTSVITVKATDGSNKTATCTVTVDPALASSITVDKTSLSVIAGQTAKLVATILPEYTANRVAIWSSSNTLIATVDQSGVITAVKAGSVVITAKTADGSNKSATCNVTVAPKIILAEKINLNHESLTINVPESAKLVSTVVPGNTTNQVRTWTVADPSICRVDDISADGKATVVALKEGVTTIKIAATDGSGAYITCVVNVGDPGATISNLTLNKSTLLIKTGASEKLIETVTPATAKNKVISWVSSDPKVATVDQTGNVTGIKAGTAMLAARTTDNSNITATCTVTVVDETTIALDKTELELTVPETAQLAATVLPETLADKSVSWSSSNLAVALVDQNGKVLSVKSGTAIITAKTNDGSNKTATCKVTVTELTTISLDQTKLAMYTQEKATLVATVLPNTVSTKQVTWTSSSPKVATVDSSGTITALAKGTVTITAKTTDGSNVTAKCIVTITEKKILTTGLKINVNVADINVGKSLKLTGRFTPVDASNQEITWKSNKEDVVRVDAKGKVIALKLGEAVVTGTAKDGSGKSITCKISVVAEPVLVDKLTLEADSVIIGQTQPVVAVIVPEQAFNKKLSWESSNTSIATVDQNGNVTGVRYGTATITAETLDGTGIVATCKITVVPKPIYIANFKLNKTTTTIELGKSDTLIPTIEPDNATTKKIVWSSSNPSIASVDEWGHVEAVSLGDVTITAQTTDDSNKKATCTVKVIPKQTLVNTFTLNKSVSSIIVGQSETLIPTIGPANASNKLVTWVSSDPKVATVDQNGTLTAIKVGKATIVANTNDASLKTATCIVTVNPIPVPITSFSIIEQTLSLVEATSKPLYVNIAPSTATNKTLTWSVDNANVATVDVDGNVTAVRYGTTFVTAKTTDGTNRSSVCTIYVTPLKATAVALNKNKTTIKLGESEKLDASIHPINASSKAIDWKVSDPTFASVDQYGVVTALKLGKTTVIATAKDGSNQAAYCEVTIVPQPILTTNIVLNKTDLTIDADMFVTLEVALAPTSITNRSLSWVSSNPLIASVDQKGKVTGLTGGSAKITVSTLDGSNKSATCNVTVNPKPVYPAGVKISKDSTVIGVGMVEKLTATILPVGVSDKTLTWSSSNPAVATVDQTGKVTAIKLGVTRITAKTSGAYYKTGTCEVTVATLATELRLLSEPEVTAKVGYTQQVYVEVAPEEASSEVSWKSSNAAIASVDEKGKVTLHKQGTVNIIATTMDGSNLSVSAKFAATGTPVLSTGLALNKTDATIADGDELQLTATVLPTNASNQGVTWKSNNVAVAYVDVTGKVIGTGLGRAVITAKTMDGSEKTASCTVTVEQKVVTAESIVLSKTTATLKLNESNTLLATVLPVDTVNKSVSWVSSDPTTVTVDGRGLITGKKLGTAVITAKSAGILLPGSATPVYRTTTCTVTVVGNKVYAKAIVLSDDGLTVPVGKLERLSATFLPGTTSDQAILWSSSDPSVAVVDANGVVRGVGRGTTLITARSTDGSNKTASCHIVVPTIATDLVTSVKLDKSDVFIRVDDSDQLTATVSPDNALDRTIAWSSNNPTIASVDGTGKVTGLESGIAVITAKALDGSNESATCTYNVVSANEPIISLSMVKTNTIIKVGSDETLKTAILPVFAGNTQLDWGSSRPLVATVDDNGKVTALSPGSTVITATTTDGTDRSASCSVTVVANLVLIKTIEIVEPTKNMYVGDSQKLKVKITPDNVSIDDLIWTSSDKDIAVFDEDGVLTAVGGGSTTITAKTTDGSNKTAKLVLNIFDEPILAKGITLNVKNISVPIGVSEELEAIITPITATVQDALWTVSDSTIAKVDSNGTVTGIKEGRVIVYAKTKDGSNKTASCTVTVTPKPGSPVKISLNLTFADLTVGETAKLKVYFTPKESAQKVTWTSSDKSIATVDANGNVKALKVGTATIKATTTDGSKKSASCKITVEKE